MINNLEYCGGSDAEPPPLTKAEMEVLLSESAQHLKTALLLLGLPVENLDYPPTYPNKPPRGGCL